MMGAKIMANSPSRVQLSRAKGWRMPPGTVKVDRSTKWGNPFIVGRHGTRTKCVDLFTRMMAGLVCLSTDNVSEQVAYRNTVEHHLGELVGRNLACWCPLGKPCHADALLMVARNASISGPERPAQEQR